LTAPGFLVAVIVLNLIYPAIAAAAPFLVIRRQRTVPSDQVAFGTGNVKSELVSDWSRTVRVWILGLARAMLAGRFR
jgi:hypothetical protein